MENEDVVFEQTYDLNSKRWKTQFSLKLIRFAIIMLVIFSIPSLVFYSFFCQLKVVGISMQPTLNEELVEGLSDEEYEKSEYQDVVVVSKFSKGDVGDIVVVKKSNKYVVKRIIAKGGQTVALKKEEGTELYAYYVDGEKLNEPYIATNYLEMDYNYFLDFTCVATSRNGNLEASLTVPDGEIFVLGDNRGISLDSHLQKCGCLKEDNVLGKVVTYYKYNTDLFSHIFSLIFG